MKSPILTETSIRVLLIDDQAFVAETIRRMLEDEEDIELFYCDNPAEALNKAEEIKPTLILQDLMMPGVDGLMLVKYFRANPLTKDVPMIVLSSKEESEVKAKAFSLGAADYLVKLPDKIELIARIRHHSESYRRLLERNLAYKKLTESQNELNRELKDAANYVRSLMPDPINEPIRTDWRFIPSLMLGGDALGYHALDEDHFAFFLLDVCGHGVGAALLSVSIENVIKSSTLPDTDFYSPKSVLISLNKAFQMEQHNHMFFTIWYGVYCISKKELVWANGGHPPAILIKEKPPHVTELPATSIIIGGVENIEVEEKRTKVEKGDRLFIFSDGIFELTRPDKSMMNYNEFVSVLSNLSQEKVSSGAVLDALIQKSQDVQEGNPFQDDVSILSIEF